MTNVSNPFATLAALSALALVPESPVAAETAADRGPCRHHITLGIGRAERITGSGMPQHNSLGQVGYRHSITRHLDVGLDYRRVRDSRRVPAYPDPGEPQREYYHRMAFWGGGVRLGTNTRTIRPFAQANVYWARESEYRQVHGPDVLSKDQAIGYGMMGGMEIRLTRVTTIPLEVSYLNGGSGTDVQTRGVQVGVTFSFGATP